MIDFEARVFGVCFSGEEQRKRSQRGIVEDRDRDLVVRGACGVDVVSRLEREVWSGLIVFWPRDGSSFKAVSRFRSRAGRKG